MIKDCLGMIGYLFGSFLFSKNLLLIVWSSIEVIVASDFKCLAMSYLLGIIYWSVEDPYLNPNFWDLRLGCCCRLLKTNF